MRRRRREKKNQISFPIKRRRRKVEFGPSFWMSGKQKLSPFSDPNIFSLSHKRPKINSTINPFVFSSSLFLISVSIPTSLSLSILVLILSLRSENNKDEDNEDEDEDEGEKC